MSKRGENIYKRKDGRWEGRYKKTRSEEGKIRYGYVYGKTYTEAKEKLFIKRNQFQKEQEAQSQNIIEPAKITFEAAALEWIDYVMKHHKISTYNKYRNLLYSYILPGLGNYPISDLSHLMIEKHLYFISEKGGKNHQPLSSKTVNDCLTVIRNIFKFASRKAYCMGCPEVHLEIKTKSKMPVTLSETDQLKLSNHLLDQNDQYAIGILLSLYTGIRLGEVCALRWENISFENQTIAIKGNLQRVQTFNSSGAKTKLIVLSPKSTCSIRTIPLPKNLMSILRKYQSISHGYVMTNLADKPMDPRTLQYHFKKILLQLNIEYVNYHTLRHSFATRCVELNFDIKTLSEILGHSNVSITMNRYVHPTLELKRTHMEKLSSLLAVI